MFPRSLALAIATAATLGLALAVAATVRIFLAERRLQTVVKDDVERVVRLTPGNSEAWARLGVLREREGDSAGAAGALEQAVRLNPFNAPAWVELALYWELEGDATRAERCLLQAVRADRSWAIHWALINFYLRQGYQDRFWEAMRTALRSTSRSDLDAAFDLCWRASQDPAEILQKALPDTPEALRAYFRYLLDRARKPAQEQVWLRLAPHLSPTDLDRGLGLRYTDQLIEDRRVPEAVQAWSRLCERRVLPFDTIDPARGRVLNNGQFQSPPSGRAFDWRLVAADGIAADRESLGPESSLKIQLSGAHAENSELLWQWVPVLADSSYRLTCRYRTDGLPSDTGLRWTAWDETTPARAELATSSPLEASGAWAESHAIIHTRRQTRLVRLVFSYQRSPGTTRARGWVSLAGVYWTSHEGTLP